MSNLPDENMPTVLANSKTTDITSKELQALEKFKERGMPGLGTLNEVVMSKSIDLYLGGKTYQEIAQIVNLKKELVLYLAQKFKWYDTKMEHLEILDANIKERIIHAKLVNQDFVLQIQQFFLRKIGRKITRFLATNDEDEAAKVDRKDIEMFYKAVELLDKISTEKVPTNSRPAVGLNLGDGVSITKGVEGEVLITPRNKTVGQMLQELANLKRQDESQKSGDDITIQGSTKNTEKEEKDES